jgi:hypothetical protein
MAETGITGAEVVKHNANTEVLNSLECIKPPLLVQEQNVLGDVQFQSRAFDEPTQLPKGKTRTLKDAVAYIMALPKPKQHSPEWQAATEAVIMARKIGGR